jgi:DNA polymerase-1
MVIGEAPAFRKEKDKPFQGDAGKILDKLLIESDVSRDEIYITNIVKCRPPGNRKPKVKEIEACNFWMQKELERVNPKFLLLLGASAAKLIGIDKVMETRGKFIKKDRVYFITFHPGAILRDESKLPLLRSDFKRFFEAAKIQKIPEIQKINLNIINSDRVFKKFLNELTLTNKVAFDIETTHLSPWIADSAIISMGFGLRDKQYVLPFQHREGYLYRNKRGQQDAARAVELFLKDRTVITHNGKFDTLWTKVKFEIDIQVTHDTMMMSHLLDENTPHGLKYLAEVHLGAQNYDLEVEEKTGGTSLKKLAEYNGLDVYYTRMLFNKLIKELKQDPALFRFYKKVIMPAVRAFRDIEYRGVYVDENKLHQAQLFLQSEIVKWGKELDKYRKNINWNSTKQLSQFLFKELNLNPLDITPGGDYSTSESVLQRLDHPVVKFVLNYREAYKMLNTFISSWLEKRVDNRLHPTFKLHGTVTGRLSCEEPNLQQVPRNPKIRSLVCAPEGYTFVEADFSQIELRVAAMLSGEFVMRDLFLREEDIHTQTAMLVSGKDLSKLKDFEAKEWRKKAKAINFGFLYGMGAKKFQEYARDKYQVDFTLEESENIRRKFFEHYPGLLQWYKKQERIALLNGYVRSPSGRIRHLPDIHSDDEYLASAAVRQAINSPVQGFASDLTLISVVDIVKELPQVKIVGTVHDSILMEIKTDELKKTLPHIEDIMANPPTLKELGVKLTIPIKAELSLGNWGSGEKIEEL